MFERVTMSGSLGVPRSRYCHACYVACDWFLFRYLNIDGCSHLLHSVRALASGICAKRGYASNLF